MSQPLPLLAGADAAAGRRSEDREQAASKMTTTGTRQIEMSLIAWLAEIALAAGEQQQRVIMAINDG